MTTDSAQSYILRQPPERQAALTQLRETILAHLPAGFEETMQYGMITYVMPKSVFPAGYHVPPHDPLPFLSLANQKNYIALYHLGLYASPELLSWFSSAYAALQIGKLDIGKSCIRFKNPAKIPYELIASLCERMTPEAFISLYQQSRK
jgi:uncharacterized protein YdhG (YjbR/CyaY superfamily)